MTDAIIVKNIAKKFTKFPDKNKWQFFLALLKEFFLHKTDTILHEGEFWAFKDLNFTIKKGEVFAILGSNGSGKSTLLKAIYGLIKTTTGSTIINGRIDALINLGAGFNQDLSGKQNIISYATIHNYPTKKIPDLVKRVIEFSELEEFINSPVKNYSSGMYARLSFALITHMNPDILIVDEVLAVGDAAFQNKCFVKMQELKQQGVTFLIVSHNQAQISQFCDRALWLEKGVLKELGETDKVLKNYIKFMNERNDKLLQKSRSETKHSLYGPIHNLTNEVKNVQISIKGQNSKKISTGSKIAIDYEFELINSTQNLNVSLNFYKLDGKLMSTINTVNGNLLKKIKTGAVKCQVKIANFNLNPGTYILVLSLIHI